MFIFLIFSSAQLVLFIVYFLSCLLPMIPTLIRSSHSILPTVFLVFAYCLFLNVFCIVALFRILTGTHLNYVIVINHSTVFLFVIISLYIFNLTSWELRVHNRYVAQHCSNTDLSYVQHMLI